MLGATVVQAASHIESHSWVVIIPVDANATSILRGMQTYSPPVSSLCDVSRDHGSTHVHVPHVPDVRIRVP